MVSHEALLGGGGAFQGVDQGEGHLAFAEVAADGLAEGLLASGEIEHIVNQLEGHAEIPGVVAEAFLRRGVAVGGEDTEAGADGEEARGLAVNQLHAVGLGDIDAADALKLQELAFHHDLGETDQQVEDQEVALAEGDLEGLHVEPVAGEDAGVVAPLGIGGRTAAAGLGGVDDVIVDQGGGVDLLDDGAEVNGGGRGAGEIAGDLAGGQAGG